MASALASAPFTELPYRLARLPKIACKPRRCALILASADGVALLASLCIGYAWVRLCGGIAAPELYLRLWPSLFAFAASFSALGLYPGVISNPVRELQRVAMGLCLGFTMLTAVTLMDRAASQYSPRFFAGAFATSVMLMPLLRQGARCLFSQKDWWGVPSVVLHTGEDSTRLLRALSRERQFGISVVAILSASEAPRLAYDVPVFDLPVFDMQGAAALRRAGVSHAIVALPETGSGALVNRIDLLENSFPRLLLMSDALSNCGLGIAAYDLHGALTVEICRNLLRPGPIVLKRLIDLGLLLLLAPFLLPIILLLGLLVRMESPGGMFYCHRRIGKDLATIYMWKIRTMYEDADVILKRTLAENADLRAEWVNTRKLACDPRVTRIGRLIRRASLDELPQLWNVLRGEMSFVGPRPIVSEETPIYGDRLPLYCRVAPGLTGLWQVSGRNDISLSDRVRLDSYYVRNWSPWLDCHILLRTIAAVLSGRGAY